MSYIEFTSSTIRFDAAEQVEDALTGLKVLEYDGNFIRLQLRTYIPKLDGLLGQHKLEHTTEPSELIHELLIYLKNKTTEITKVEVRTLSKFHCWLVYDLVLHIEKCISMLLSFE